MTLKEYLKEWDCGIFHITKNEKNDILNKENKDFTKEFINIKRKEWGGDIKDDDISKPASFGHIIEFINYDKLINLIKQLQSGYKISINKLNALIFQLKRACTIINATLEIASEEEGWFDGEGSMSKHSKKLDKEFNDLQRIIEKIEYFRNISIKKEKR